MRFEDVALSIIFGGLMLLILSFGVWITSYILSTIIGKIIIGGSLALWYYGNIPEAPKDDK